MNPPARPHRDAAADIAIAVAGGILFATGAAVWAGARLATALTGGRLDGGLVAAFRAAARLGNHPGDPATAWGDAATGMPGPVVYWLCTAIVAVLVVAAAAGVWWLWRRWATPSRHRLGVPLDARIATAHDVVPLVVETAEPPTGRFLLGRHGRRGPFLATEDRERHPMSGWRGEELQGDRGSVALIGPTRSGKTVLATAGIIGWDGPVVALSVKRDLYDTTASARANLGAVAVFDPGSVTGLPTARWTPLRDVMTSSGALRSGRALAQAIPRTGVTGGDFWATHGETLTSAYMCLAGLSRHLPAHGKAEPEPLTIGRLASWAYMHVGISHPVARHLVVAGSEHSQPIEVRLLAADAMTKLMAFEHEDPKIRASIYATARLAFSAWTEPAVAHSASTDARDFYFSDEIPSRRPQYIDLDWLMGGGEGTANTLYLTAPSNEFARLAPVLGGLLGDLREQIHAWDIAGRRLEKPLLIVIDEAGQLELQWLPEEVSTIAGLGGMFVTCWQSRAQIIHRYGTLADAVLGGHRSKVIFNGTDDLSTLEYVSKVAGTLQVPQRGWSADTGGGRRTVSEHLQREELLPAHVIRQMRRHRAVLLHGSLPPIDLRAVRWWKNDALKARLPRDERGRLLGPPRDGTCPAVFDDQHDVTPAVDQAVTDEAVRQLLNIRTAHPTAPTPTARPARAGQDELPFDVPVSSAAGPARAVPDAPAEQGDTNRTVTFCDRCGRRLQAGNGVISSVGSRQVTRCNPTCAPGAS